MPTTWEVVADGTNHVFAQQDATLGRARVAGGEVAWTDQAVEARVKFLTMPDQGAAGRALEGYRPVTSTG